MVNFSKKRSADGGAEVLTGDPKLGLSTEGLCQKSAGALTGRSGSDVKKGVSAERQCQKGLKR